MKSYSMVAFLLTATLLSTACSDQSSPRGDTSGEATSPRPMDASPPSAAPATVASTFESMDPIDTQAAVKARCALDMINGERARGATIRVVAGEETRFRGWVADPQRRVPDAFTIVLAGKTSYGAAAKAGNIRNDVARATKIKALSRSGFDVTAQLAQVAPGEYTVGLAQGSGNGAAYCATGTTVVVSPAG